MKSLFNQSDSQEIVDRIQKLNASTKPGWGKMTVAQMVTHSQKPFKVAFEEMQLKRGLIGIVFGGMARKQLTNEVPFKRNLPTDRNFVVSDHPDFEKEKNTLIDYVKRFQKQGPSGITKLPHPFFGKLSSDQWDKLMYKHLDHHLRQFGV